MVNENTTKLLEEPGKATIAGNRKTIALRETPEFLLRKTTTSSGRCERLSLAERKAMVDAFIEAERLSYERGMAASEFLNVHPFVLHGIDDDQSTSTTPSTPTSSVGTNLSSDQELMNLVLSEPLQAIPENRTETSGTGSIATDGSSLPLEPFNGSRSSSLPRSVRGSKPPAIESCAQATTSHSDQSPAENNQSASADRRSCDRSSLPIPSNVSCSIPCSNQPRSVVVKTTTTTKAGLVENGNSQSQSPTRSADQKAATPLDSSLAAPAMTTTSRSSSSSCIFRMSFRRRLTSEPSAKRLGSALSCQDLSEKSQIPSPTRKNSVIESSTADGCPRSLVSATDAAPPVDVKQIRLASGRIACLKTTPVAPAKPPLAEPEPDDCDDDSSPYCSATSTKQVSPDRETGSETSSDRFSMAPETVGDQILRLVKDNRLQLQQRAVSSSPQLPRKAFLKTATGDSSKLPRRSPPAEPRSPDAETRSVDLIKQTPEQKPLSSGQGLFWPSEPSSVTDNNKVARSTHANAKPSSATGNSTNKNNIDASTAATGSIKKPVLVEKDKSNALSKQPKDLEQCSQKNERSKPQTSSNQAAQLSLSLAPALSDASAKVKSELKLETQPSAPTGESKSHVVATETNLNSSTALERFRSGLPPNPTSILRPLREQVASKIPAASSASAPRDMKPISSSNGLASSKPVAETVSATPVENHQQSNSNEHQAISDNGKRQATLKQQASMMSNAKILPASNSPRVRHLSCKAEPGDAARKQETKEGTKAALLSKCASTTDLRQDVASSTPATNQCSRSSLQPIANLVSTLTSRVMPKTAPPAATSKKLPHVLLSPFRKISTTTPQQITGTAGPAPVAVFVRSEMLKLNAENTCELTPPQQQVEMTHVGGGSKQHEDTTSLATAVQCLSETKVAVAGTQKLPPSDVRKVSLKPVLQRYSSLASLEAASYPAVTVPIPTLSTKLASLETKQRPEKQQPAFGFESVLKKFNSLCNFNQDSQAAQAGPRASEAKLHETKREQLKHSSHSLRTCQSMANIASSSLEASKLCEKPPTPLAAAKKATIGSSCQNLNQNTAAKTTNPASLQLSLTKQQIPVSTSTVVPAAASPSTGPKRSQIGSRASEPKVPEAKLKQLSYSSNSLRTSRSMTNIESATSAEATKPLEKLPTQLTATNKTAIGSSCQNLADNNSELGKPTVMARAKVVEKDTKAVAKLGTAGPELIKAGTTVIPKPAITDSKPVAPAKMASAQQPLPTLVSKQQKGLGVSKQTPSLLSRCQSETNISHASDSSIAQKKVGKPTVSARAEVANDPSLSARTTTKAILKPETTSSSELIKTAIPKPEIADSEPVAPVTLSSAQRPLPGLLSKQQKDLEVSKQTPTLLSRCQSETNVSKTSAPSIEQKKDSSLAKLKPVPLRQKAAETATKTEHKDQAIVNETKQLNVQKTDAASSQTTTTKVKQQQETKRKLETLEKQEKTTKEIDKPANPLTEVDKLQKTVAEAENSKKQVPASNKDQETPKNKFQWPPAPRNNTSRRTVDMPSCSKPGSSNRNNLLNATDLIVNVTLPNAVARKRQPLSPSLVKPSQAAQQQPEVSVTLPLHRRPLPPFRKQQSLEDAARKTLVKSHSATTPPAPPLVADIPPFRKQLSLDGTTGDVRSAISDKRPLEAVIEELKESRDSMVAIASTAAQRSSSKLRPPLLRQARQHKDSTSEASNDEAKRRCDDGEAKLMKNATDAVNLVAASAGNALKPAKKLKPDQTLSVTNNGSPVRPTSLAISSNAAVASEPDKKRPSPSTAGSPSSGLPISKLLRKLSHRERKEPKEANKDSNSKPDAASCSALTSLVVDSKTVAAAAKCKSPEPRSPTAPKLLSKIGRRKSNEKQPQPDRNRMKPVPEFVGGVKLKKALTQKPKQEFHAELESVRLRPVQQQQKPLSTAVDSLRQEQPEAARPRRSSPVEDMVQSKVSKVLPDAIPSIPLHVGETVHVSNSIVPIATRKDLSSSSKKPPTKKQRRSSIATKDASNDNSQPTTLASPLPPPQSPSVEGRKPLVTSETPTAGTGATDQLPPVPPDLRTKHATTATTKLRSMVPLMQTQSWSHLAPVKPRAPDSSLMFIPTHVPGGIKPEFWMKPKSLVVNEGGLVTMECSVLAFPEPKISIYLNDDYLQASDKIQVFVIRSVRVFSLYFIIDGVTKEESGTLTFVASNEVGTSMCSINVHVVDENDSCSSVEQSEPAVTRILTAVPCL